MDLVGIRNEAVWFLVLIDRHNAAAASRAADADGSFFLEDGVVEVYPLMLRITVLRETKAMKVKISKKVCLDSLLPRSL